MGIAAQGLTAPRPPGDLGRASAAAPRLPLPPLVLAGLAALYLPIYAELAESVWSTDEHGHGPLILLVSGVLLWRLRSRLASLPADTRPISGSVLLLVGLVLAWLGRTQDIAFFTTASQIPVLAGILLVLHGAAGLRAAAFPLLYLLFMVPLPGALVDPLTLDLKEAISAAAASALHAIGYPVARSGVIVLIGQFQLLVADACSGMHSLISLTALGVLYIHLQPPASRLHRLAMLAAIIPAAIAANFLRTLVLILLTYHAGDTVTRSWHDGLGILLFFATLALLAGVDALLRRGTRARATP